MKKRSRRRNTSNSSNRKKTRRIYRRKLKITKGGSGLKECLDIKRELKKVLEQIQQCLSTDDLFELTINNNVFYLSKDDVSVETRIIKNGQNDKSGDDKGGDDKGGDDKGGDDKAGDGKIIKNKNYNNPVPVAGPTYRRNEAEIKRDADGGYRGGGLSKELRVNENDFYDKYFGHQQ